MDKLTRTNLDNLWSQDRDLQNRAFTDVLATTDKPVDWAYEVWDRLLKGLKHKDNHVRAISAQVLCNLAKSDPQYRMLKNFDDLLAVTKDERFVTARHCLQSLWKIGVVGKSQREIVLAGLERRFRDCAQEKNCTLIRYDIVQNFRNIYDSVPDDKISQQAERLIESEDDLKYRKKYARLWRSK